MARAGTQSGSAVKGAGYVPPATPGTWRRRRPISLTRSSPRCRCVNEYCRCPSGCAISCSAIPRRSARCCTSCCAVIETSLRERSGRPGGRLGAVSFVQRFGSALNAHVHFHCCVLIEGRDRAGLEQLLRYCARPSIALEHLEQLAHDQIVYRFPKPGANGKLSPLRGFIDRSQNRNLPGQRGCRRTGESLDRPGLQARVAGGPPGPRPRNPDASPDRR